MIINSKMPLSDADSFRVPNGAVDVLTESGCATYLAVYLYALRQYQAGNCSISNSAIADALKISTIDVVNAFMFYSSQGYLKIHRFTSVDDGDFDIEFCAKENSTKPSVAYRPSYKTSEITRRLKENPRMSQMYQLVSQILGKTLSSADTELLYSFYDYYALPIEVIVVLIDYYAAKGKRSMKFLEKEVGKWASSGIDTVPKAKAYIKKREEFLSFTSRVRTILGIQERSFTTRELSYINQWQNDFAMSPEQVKAAYEKTVDQTGKLSFAYMNKILESWSKSESRNEKKMTGTQKKETKKNRYDFEALERQAMAALNNPDRRNANNGL